MEVEGEAHEHRQRQASPCQFAVAAAVVGLVITWVLAASKARRTEREVTAHGNSGKQSTDRHTDTQTDTHTQTHRQTHHPAPCFAGVSQRPSAARPGDDVSRVLPAAQARAQGHHTLLSPAQRRGAHAPHRIRQQQQPPRQWCKGRTVGRCRDNTRHLSHRLPPLGATRPPSRDAGAGGGRGWWQVCTVSLSLYPSVLFRHTPSPHPALLRRQFLGIGAIPVLALVVGDSGISNETVVAIGGTGAMERSRERSRGQERERGRERERESE